MDTLQVGGQPGLQKTSKPTERKGRERGEGEPDVETERLRWFR